MPDSKVSLSSFLINSLTITFVILSYRFTFHYMILCLYSLPHILCSKELLLVMFLGLWKMQKRIKLSLKWTKHQLCMWDLERYCYLDHKHNAFFERMFAKFCETSIMLILLQCNPQVSLTEESLRENVGAFMNALLQAKPAGLKKSKWHLLYKCLLN